MESIFESLENLNVSEACFEDIIGLVEEYLSEGRLVDDNGNKTEAYYNLRDGMVQKLNDEKSIARGQRKQHQKEAKKSEKLAKEIEKNVIPKKEHDHSIAVGNQLEREASYTDSFNRLGRNNPETMRKLEQVKSARKKGHETFSDLQTARNAANGKRWNAYVEDRRAREAQSKTAEKSLKARRLGNS